MGVVAPGENKWRNISTIYIHTHTHTHTHIYIYIYIYIYITRLASKEIVSPSNNIHREVSGAQDLSPPLYIHCPRIYLIAPDTSAIRQKAWVQFPWLISARIVRDILNYSR